MLQPMCESAQHHRVLHLQAGALAEACNSYAAEARRLGTTGTADEVATQFTELQQMLEAL